MNICRFVIFENLFNPLSSVWLMHLIHIRKKRLNVSLVLLITTKCNHIRIRIYAPLSENNFKASSNVFSGSLNRSCSKRQQKGWSKIVFLKEQKAEKNISRLDNEWCISRKKDSKHWLARKSQKNARKNEEKHFNRILMAESCWHRENSKNFIATHQLGENK